MNGTLRDHSHQFAAAVRAGQPMAEVMDEHRPELHHDDVLTAAIEMLATEGAIDMKRLAAAAGMSRASLYRYYPDRGELIREIAHIAVKDMTSAAEALADPPARIHAVGDYMLTHPAESAAMLEMAQQASVDALDSVAERLVGDEIHAPWLIGLASMCAGPRLSESDVARVRQHIALHAQLVGG